MPTLHALIAGSKKARDIKEISDSEAIKILSTYASEFKTEAIYLSGEPSRLQFYATPNRYVVLLKSKLETYEAGYYLLEAKATQEELTTLLKK